MHPYKILVVDDEPGAVDVLVDLFERQDYEVAAAGDGEEALALLQDTAFDLVITDLNMPKVNGLELLERVQQADANMVSIILTGCGTIDNAVAAMKAGAYDYITKPLKIDELLLTVRRALEFRSLKAENRNLKRLVGRDYGFENFVGGSEAMQEVFALIRKVADTDTTVLIQGESGTGKELVARAIHFHSERTGAPLVPINCAAIPYDLLESELFGHVKGAFTGASIARVGRFELADGGTIFLDEIADMPPELQVKILRVLQEHQFERVGGTQTIHVNVRILAATNRDLEKEIRKGRFREDLFYRLNVVPIHLPPLRERVEDIPLLVHHFLDRLNRTRPRVIRGFTREAMQCLEAFSWPGNVRELENLVERMSILAEGELVEWKDLPEKFHAAPVPAAGRSWEIPPQGISLNQAVEAYENELIAQALKRAEGVKSRAAKLLHLNRTTLVEKIKKMKSRGFVYDEAEH